MNSARTIALLALLSFGLLSAILPPMLTPLHAFVPEPYFLRSKSQLENSRNPKDFHNYLTRPALPFILGMALILLVWAAFACFTSSRPSAISLLIAVLALPFITLLRLGAAIAGIH